MACSDGWCGPCRSRIRNSSAADGQGSAIPVRARVEDVAAGIGQPGSLLGDRLRCSASGTLARPHPLLCLRSNQSGGIGRATVTSDGLFFRCEVGGLALGGTPSERFHSAPVRFRSSVTKLLRAVGFERAQHSTHYPAGPAADGPSQRRRLAVSVAAHLRVGTRESDGRTRDTTGPVIVRRTAHLCSPVTARSGRRISGSRWHVVAIRL